MRRFWTVPDLRELRTLYPSTSNAELAKRFGRNRKAIGLMALKLGLKKSEEHVRQHCRFQPGHSTWNAGKPWNPQGSRATQFKKGQRGPRQRRVGDERMERDGLYVKVAEPNVWESKARIVWRKNFGPIPEGMLVRLKDGDKANCAPENLMPTSRAENARLNTKARRPRRKPTSWVQPIARGPLFDLEEAA